MDTFLAAIPVSPEPLSPLFQPGGRFEGWNEDLTEIGIFLVVRAVLVPHLILPFSSSASTILIIFTTLKMHCSNLTKPPSAHVHVHTNTPARTNTHAHARTLSRALSLLKMLAILDVAVATPLINPKGRWFFLHTAANIVATFAAWPDVVRGLTDPVMSWTGRSHTMFANSAISVRPRVSF